MIEATQEQKELYNRQEDNNLHGDNVILLAEINGDDTLTDIAKLINRDHHMYGLSKGASQIRYDLEKYLQTQVNID